MYNHFYELMNALNNDEIDMIGNSDKPSLNLDMNGTVYQTPATLYWGVGLFVKSLSVEQTMNPFEYFSYEWWLSVITVTACLQVCIRFINAKLRLTFASLKIVILIWFLFISLIMEMYGNVLTSNLLSSEKEKPLFNSLDELGEKLLNKQCRYVIFDQYVNDSDIYEVYYPEHNKSWAKSFRQAFKRNPPIEVKSKIEMFAIVQNSSCTVGLDYIALGMDQYEFLCSVEMKTFPSDFTFKPYGYYHRIKELNEAFNIIFASDPFQQLSNLLLKKYTKLDLKLFPKSCENEGNTQMSLLKLYPCFIILIAGMFCSFMATVCCNIRYNMHQSHFHFKCMNLK